MNKKVRPTSSDRWALPKNSGYADVARALDVSPPTVKDYFTIAHEIFLWRNLSAYVKNPA